MSIFYNIYEEFYVPCRGSDSSLFEMRNALTFKLVLFIYCLFRVTCHCIQRTHFIPDFFCCCSSGLWTTESSRWLLTPQGYWTTHNSLTQSWSDLSYPISPVTLLTYYHILNDFIRSSAFADPQSLYIHATVMLPFSVILSLCVHFRIYNVFLHNTPIGVSRGCSRLGFRLFFVSTTVIGD